MSKNKWTISLPVPNLTSNVPPIQMGLMIFLMLMGFCLLYYGIRIQVKLAGVLIDLATMSLFLIKDKKILNMKEKIQMWLTILLIAVMGITVWRMLSVDGPQPVTPKNYVPPDKVIEKKLVEGE